MRSRLKYVLFKQGIDVQTGVATSAELVSFSKQSQLKTAPDNKVQESSVLARVSILLVEPGMGCTYSER